MDSLDVDTPLTEVQSAEIKKLYADTNIVFVRYPFQESYHGRYCRRTENETGDGGISFIYYGAGGYHLLSLYVRRDCRIFRKAALMEIYRFCKKALDKSF